MQIVYDSEKFTIKSYGTDPVYVVVDKGSKEIIVGESEGAQRFKEFLDLDVDDTFKDTMCRAMFEAAYAQVKQ